MFSYVSQGLGTWERVLPSQPQWERAPPKLAPLACVWQSWLWPSKAVRKLQSPHWLQQLESCLHSLQCMQGSWSWPLGGSVCPSGGLNWPTQLLFRPIFSALSWSTPMSAPPISCWSLWRDQSAETELQDLHACKSRTSQSFCGGAILTAYQKPETLSQTNNLLQGTSASKVVWGSA